MVSISSIRDFCAFFLARLLVLAAAITLMSGATSNAQDVVPVPAEDPQPARSRSVPTEYGEIIFRKNPQAPQQIYIIGQSHRSALTGRAGPDLIEVQAEIYRIGEWLILENNVELLLPEGFFQKTTAGKVAPPEIVRESRGLDSQTLKDRLSDPVRLVNADMLLNASYNIPLGQVENEQLYRDIHNLLNQARQPDNFAILSELNGLQDERTTIMLQNIPDIVDEAYRAGHIDNRRAMFTIGLAHIRTIINNLQGGSLLAPTQPDPAEGEKNEVSWKLLAQGYGVTVIIPRTLADNQRVLRLARLATE